MYHACCVALGLFVSLVAGFLCMPSASCRGMVDDSGLKSGTLMMQCWLRQSRFFVCADECRKNGLSSVEET